MREKRVESERVKSRIGRDPGALLSIYPTEVRKKKTEDRIKISFISSFESGGIEIAYLISATLFIRG